MNSIRFVIFAVCISVCLANRQKAATTTQAATTPAANPTNAPTDATAFCFQCRQRRNHKDLYADPIDCRNYYQCFYINETFAVGYLRRCAAGLFWHDEVLSCLPEGAVPCVDQCRIPAIAGVGLYAGTSCRQYYVCANTASYGMCCPSGTRFNPATFICDEDATCTTPCSQSAPAVQTTVAPARLFNSTVCIDSFGAYLTGAANEANAFYTIDIATGQVDERQYCPSGVLFNLAACRCNTEDPSATVPTIRARLFKLWLPFNGNTLDQSTSKFTTFLYDGAAYDASTGVAGSGGSLAVNGGYLSVPGMKSLDTRQAGSWFASFRCNGVCAAGTLISNNKDSTGSEFTIQLYLSNSNTVSARLHFWAPVGTITLSATFTIPASGWVNVGVTYGNDVANLYVNGVVAASQNIGGYLEIAHCPYVFGTDQQYGTFNGNIDLIAVARSVFSQSEVAAIASGDLAAVRATGLH